MPNNCIFVITALCNAIDGRAFGWFFEFEQAEAAVRENALDMNEAGHHPWIVIEQYEPGIHCTACREWWHQFENGAYQSTEKPDWALQTTNWALG
jgi:hypothetical protein